MHEFRFRLEHKLTVNKNKSSGSENSKL